MPSTKMSTTSEREMREVHRHERSVLAHLWTGLFNMAFVMAKEVNISSAAVVASKLVDFVQMLAFPLNAKPVFPWSTNGDGTVLAIVSRSLDYVTTDTVDEVHSASAYVTLFAIAVSWTTLFVGLSFWVAWSFSQQRAQSGVVLRLLRSMAWLSTTILFLPFSAVMFRALTCAGTDGWVNTGIECYHSWHLLTVMAVALVLPCFFALASFTAAVFVDRNVKAPSLSSAINGRAEAAMLVVKVVLTFVYNVLIDALRDSWVVPMLVLVSGFCWVGVAQLYRPHFIAWVNDLHTGLGTAYLWASIMLIIAKAYDGPADWTAAVLLGMATSGIAGAACSRIRQQRVASMPLSKLRSLYDYHVWIAGKLAERRQVRSMDHASLKELAFMNSVNGVDEALMLGGDASSDESSEPIPPPRIVRASVKVGPAPAARATAPHVRETAPLRDRSKKGDSLKQHMQRTLLDHAERAVKAMTSSFPQSSMAHAMAAQFYRHFHPNQYLEMMSLARASRLAPSLDVRFFVHQRAQQLREEADYGSAGASEAQSSLKRGLSPIDRVLFDQQWSECQSLYKSAYRNLLTLWEVLDTARPDLFDIQTSGDSLRTVLARMHYLFRNLLRINPDSATVLRAYADFLLNLANDPSKAAECVNKADRIEEVHAKQHNKPVSHIVFKALVTEQLSLMDDTAATVAISADTTNMGEILAVSASCCRLFGFSKVHLIGHNVSMLVPTPFRRAHDMWLRQFAQRGSSTVIGATRMLLAQGKDMHIFPVYLTLKEAPPTKDSMAPRIVGILRRVQTSERHLLIGTASTNYRVHAGCAMSLTAMGVLPDNLDSGAVSALTWFPALADDYGDSRGGGGDSVQAGEPSLVPIDAAEPGATEAGAADLLRPVGPIDKFCEELQLSLVRNIADDVTLATVQLQSLRLPFVDPLLMVCWRPVDRRRMAVSPLHGAASTSSMLSYLHQADGQAGAYAPGARSWQGAATDGAAGAPGAADRRGDGRSHEGTTFDESCDNGSMSGADSGDDELGAENLSSDDDAESDGDEKQPAFKGRQLAASSRSSHRMRGKGLHRQENDAKSVGSRSSGSAASPMIQLRRSLQSYQKQQEPEVRVMHRTLLGIVVTVLAIAVFVAIAFSAVGTRLTLHFDSLYRSGHRLVSLQSAVVGVYELQLIAQGDIHKAYEGIHQRIATRVDGLEVAHRRVLDADRRIGRVVLEVNAELIPFAEPSLRGEVRHYNLTQAQAGFHMVSLFRTVLREHRQPTGFAAPSVARSSLFLNFHNLQDLFNASSHAKQRDFAEYVDDVQLAQFASFASLFAAILLISGAIFIRQIRSLRERSDMVLKVFLHIPRPVLKASRQQALVRYESSLFQEANDTEDGNVTDQDMGSQSMHMRHLESAATFDADDTVNWDKLIRRNRHSAGQARLNDYRNSSSFVLRNTTMMLLPLTLIAVWGGSMYWAGADSATTAATSTYRMVLTQYQNTLMGSTLTSTLQVLKFDMSAAERVATITQINSRLQRLLSFNELIVDGGSLPSLHERYGRATSLDPLSSSDRAYPAMMENACLVHHNRTDCERAGRGIFNHGLHSAARDFSTLSTRVIFDRTYNTSDAAASARMMRHVIELVDLYEDYFEHMLYSTSDAFREQAIELITSQVRADMIASFVIAVIFAMFTVLVYWPAVDRLSLSLRNTRALLLLIPEPVVTLVPEIWEGVRHVVLEGDSVRSGKTALAMDERAAGRGGAQHPAPRRDGVSLRAVAKVASWAHRWRGRASYDA